MLQKNHKNGTVFKIGTKDVVYLFEYKGVHYGVDLLMYKITLRTVKIYNIYEKQGIYVLPQEELFKIIDFLNSKNVQPLKKIKKIYETLRLTIYN